MPLDHKKQEVFSASTTPTRAGQCAVLHGAAPKASHSPSRDAPQAGVNTHQSAIPMTGTANSLSAERSRSSDKFFYFVHDMEDMHLLQSTSYGKNQRNTSPSTLAQVENGEAPNIFSYDEDSDCEDTDDECCWESGDEHGTTYDEDMEKHQSVFLVFLKPHARAKEARVKKDVPGNGYDADNEKSEVEA